MEAFSLLKYWSGAGGVFNRDTSSSPRTTILTAVTPSSSSDSDNDNDDGPFFDLEFTLPDDSDSEDQIKEQDVNKEIVQQLENMNIQKDYSAEDENEGDDEIKVTLSSSSSNSADSGDHNNVALSHPHPPPSDDLFFKGRLIPIDSAASETIPKFPVSSILKSATKFRVQMLKFNKSKSNLRQKDKPTKPEPNETVLPNSSPPKSQQRKDQHRTVEEEEEEVRQDSKPNSKFFTVKLKVEEVMPLASLLFTRDHNGSSNSKGSSSSHSKASSKQNGSINNNVPNTDVENTEDEKKFSKDVLVHKYFKKVKPLYVRVSKRYGEKLRFSGQLSFSKSKADGEKQPASGGMHEEVAGEVGEVMAASNGKIQKQGNLQAGLRVVGKHLGKSRSASASVPPTESSRRRDDSLLQQQDGIQSAILHCKTCFNASRDLEGSILSRSVSDSSHENR